MKQDMKKNQQEMESKQAEFMREQETERQRIEEER